ncbi:sulfate transporter [Gordonia sp. zg691]|uniref:sulfate transporter n=1 Tax=Gordonia jinghuaiqii TaxID=2758710 RepID=UPI0016622213|nr:sulfate transporter [Gordonia jinghuaiqii]MBD0860375.1 sulfate transporter [Gordonia jinghuaiqii]
MSSDDLSVRALRRESATVLVVSGVLDSSTYLEVRDAVVKAATDAPECLIVDVRELRAPSSSAWSVLTSAAWLVREWPNVPIAAVADQIRMRELIRGGITRYVPAYSSLDSALDHIGDHQATRVTHRTRTTVPRYIGSPVAAARGIVVDTVEGWNIDYSALASLLTTILVSNVLAHTHSDPDIRVEVHGNTRLIVAVSDESADLPLRAEDTSGHTPVASGLALLTSLTRHWGCTPTAGGKTVWAVAGPGEVARFSESMPSRPD